MRHLPSVMVDRMTDDEYDRYLGDLCKASINDYKETGVAYSMEEVFAHAREAVSKVNHDRTGLAGGDAACSL